MNVSISCPFAAMERADCPVTIQAARFCFEIASFSGALHPRAEAFSYRTLIMQYICSIVKEILSRFFR